MKKNKKRHVCITDEIVEQALSSASFEISHVVHSRDKVLVGHRVRDITFPIIQSVERDIEVEFFDDE